MNNKEKQLLQKTKEKIQEVFGDDLTEEEYLSSSNDSINILSYSPEKGVFAHATLGVCLHHKMRESGEDIGFEFVAVENDDGTDVIRGLLSTCAYAIMDGLSILPYDCLCDIMQLYLPDSKMKHLLLIPPACWGDNLLMQKFESITIIYLMLCPISESEFSFVEKIGWFDGAIKLLEEFQKRNVDIFDLYREPVF